MPSDFQATVSVSSSEIPLLDPEALQFDDFISLESDAGIETRNVQEEDSDKPPPLKTSSSVDYTSEEIAKVFALGGHLTESQRNRLLLAIGRLLLDRGLISIDDLVGELDR